MQPLSILTNTNVYIHHTYEFLQVSQFTQSSSTFFVGYPKWSVFHEIFQASSSKFFWGFNNLLWISTANEHLIMSYLTFFFPLQIASCDLVLLPNRWQFLWSSSSSPILRRYSINACQLMANKDKAFALASLAKTLCLNLD